MVNNVKPGYVNPLTMMKNGRNGIHLNAGGMKTAEKQQKSLEAEKQSIQNSLLLMKGASGDAATSEESIELLEKRLEEITKELQTGRQETAKEMLTEKEQADGREPSALRRNFDLFSREESLF